MEPESLLPYSQAPATCSYPEQDKSNPCLPIPLLQDTFQYNPHTLTEITKIKMINKMYLLNVPRNVLLI
jgi:hypothetical protein